MTLEELLSELREGILNDRTDRESGTSDYLWTDAQLVRYINEAQNRLATKGLVIRDGSTDEVTLVTLVEDQTIYQLHESIIAVISAKLEDQVADLSRVGHDFLNAYRQPTDTWADPFSSVTLSPGSPLAFSTDEDLRDADDGAISTVTLRVYPAPSEALAGEQLRLRVVRKPLDSFAVGNLSAVPEVPGDHHLDMLDWAAYLALRVVDDDAGNPKRAAEFEARFERTCREARRLAMRKLFAPMGWGFGRGGFVWER